MDISVIISWKTTPRVYGWTMRSCPSCGGVTPVVVDELVQTVSVYLVPVYKFVAGHQCRCDLCDNILVEGRPEDYVPANEWERSRGLSRLAQILRRPPPDRLPDDNQVIDSLLASVSERSRLDSLDISFGLTTGCILGALAGAAVGYLVVPDQFWGMDLLGRVSFGIFSGLAIGGLLGGTIDALIRRRSLPFEKLKSVIENYSLDAEKILAAAASHPRRVRAAALRACHSTRFASPLQSDGRGP